MLLNNFSNILSAKLTNGSGTTMGDKLNYIKTTDETIYENSVKTTDVYLYKVPTSGSTYPEQSGIKLVLANDENEIDYYDYKIDNIDEQLTEISTTINKSNNYIISKIVKNNTTNDININTIGVIVHCYINNYNTFKDILIYKTKLNETIIIEPGETKTFTITIG